MRPDRSQAFRLTDSGTSSASLVREGQKLEIRVLADDLVRIRVLSSPDVKPPTSFAVEKIEWDAPAARIRQRSGYLEITTASTVFRFSLKTGAWQWTDSQGLILFQSESSGFSTVSGGISLRLNLVDGESIFGLGEMAGSWNLRGRQREFWNVDVLGVAPAIYSGIPSLYLSIPFALSMRDGRAAGLFWDNPGRQSWDIGAAQLDCWTISTVAADADLYLFAGPGVSQVVGRYTELTGRIPLPPRWGLGYHQCRYSYTTRKEFEQVAREFRLRGLPCDALYLDIHHMDRYRVFTFGPDFARPAGMIRRLSKQGFQVVTIVDPGVKEDPDFPVFERLAEADAFVKAPDGVTDFVGEVWPGNSRFPDFFSESVRRRWGDEQSALVELGVAGIWNDMNEPANFARPDKTLDPECVHRTIDGVTRHAAIHNAYGSEMARASRDGMLVHGQGRRPFVITRAGYAGIQRNALVWTGDNSSTWDHLRDVIPQLLHLSISGVPYCGADVGGFLGNCTPELFVRWLQLATFTPFFRNHSNIGTRAQEPWAFGQEVEEICRYYLHLRYQLLPHLYLHLAEARTSGTPLIRPLFWHYPNDPRSVACGSQFLLGQDILVAPILEAGVDARSVYLPPDLWYDYWTGEQLSGGESILADAPLDRIPIFVRAGTLLALGSVGPWAGAEDRSTVTLACWPGRAGQLDWYEDDESSEAYQQGSFNRRNIRLGYQRRQLTVEFSPTTGSFTSRVKRWKLVVNGGRHPKRVRINGQESSGSEDAEAAAFEIDIPNQSGQITIELTGL